MKHSLFIILGLVLLGFTACNLKSESNYQPDIEFVKNPLLNDSDTLHVYYTDQGYRLDTIRVGDTVSFQLYITGFANNLKEFYLTTSSDSVSEVILPSKTSLDSIFLPTSNYNQGKFLFAGTATALFFPFKFVAKKVSADAKITFSVMSDATIDYNQFSFVLKTPIIKAKTVTNN